MAEIFGAVVAGFAVCHELSRLAKFIHEANKTIQNSRKDIAELSDETVIFAGLYGTFLQSCEDNPEACQKTASSLQRLKSWADSTIHDLKNILSKVDILRLNKDYRYSFNETLRAELKWFFSKNAVTLLRTSLSVARQSIEGFSNLMCLGKLNEELKVLRSALRSASKRQAVEQRLGMSLEDKIKSIQQRV
jgi:cell division protein ZapA (FtsZ GTPase activity inhibitor)